MRLVRVKTNKLNYLKHIRFYDEADIVNWQVRGPDATEHLRNIETKILSFHRKKIMVFFLE